MDGVHKDNEREELEKLIEEQEQRMEKPKTKEEVKLTKARAST